MNQRQNAERDEGKTPAHSVGAELWMGTTCNGDALLVAGELRVRLGPEQLRDLIGVSIQTLERLRRITVVGAG